MVKREYVAAIGKGSLAMQCLSIWQPWADLIVHGRKDIENRRWATAHHGPLLIHAGSTFVEDHGVDDRRLGDADRWIIESARKRLGVIVGVVSVTDCVTAHPSPWFFGPFGFVLTKARLFSRPVPWPDGKRLFDVPETWLPEWPL